MIITVASFKGGVAKTTTAVHLATCLNEKAKTLLIDGDPNRSASGWAKRGNLPFTVIDERQAAIEWLVEYAKVQQLKYLNSRGLAGHGLEAAFLLTIFITRSYFLIKWKP